MLLGIDLEEEGDDSDEQDVILKCENIHKTYLLGIEGVAALRGVSLTVKRGEFVSIFGTSGGGKTTLLNVLGTIDKPTKGYLTCCGVRIGSKTKDTELSSLRLRNLGFVFQTFNLLSSLTALENVELPMVLNGVLSASERRERASQLLTRVGMGDRLDHVPSQLSGGEQQRVTIARAIANKPDVLLLDEPTGDLDSMNTMIVMELLTELNKKEQITLIMVTHDQGLKFFADRIVWMRDGKIQRVETVDDRKKEETYQQLAADMEALNAERQGEGGASNVKSARDPANPWANTTMRTRDDYAMFRGMQGHTHDLANMTTGIVLDEYVMVEDDYQPDDAGELQAIRGDVCILLDRKASKYHVRDARDRQGWLPAAICRVMTDADDGHGQWLVQRSNTHENQLFQLSVEREVEDDEEEEEDLMHLI